MLFVLKSFINSLLYVKSNECRPALRKLMTIAIDGSGRSGPWLRVWQLRSFAQTDTQTTIKRSHWVYYLFTVTQLKIVVKSRDKN